MLKIHKSKITGNGRAVVMLPIVVFSDGTSGNKTKKCNRLETYSMILAGLPCADVRKFPNIHLLTASNIVDSCSLGKAIADDLKGKYEKYCIIPCIIMWIIVSMYILCPCTLLPSH